ncbi:formate dehydrogenase accessory protein FdhE [Nonomuraea zeae]|uniref:Formate dehydrogenase accessory protein FdhE n=1 Tax=Nonomuraea zeae TaxID=1642303 RepID=A0A5S4G0K2_9ACTN|nr:formate dehydrogenase accessory protein FdhE [Nonomuraea zeae]TMR26469.1 formate dehydrogenase accessory protein FdhE [Nonomuraea zeae]
MYGGQRTRAEALRARYPHAAEILGLYLALVEVWESVAGDVPAEGAVGWARLHVLPRVAEATLASGPPLLSAAVAVAVASRTGTVPGTGTPDGGGFSRDDGEADGLLVAWIADEELTPVERYLARATLRVVPPQPASPGPASPGVAAAGRCPVCGGPPQLSYRAAGDDPLVSGRRMLICAKCGNEWHFSATTCPNCGETGKRTVYAEARAGPPAGRARPPGDRAAGPQRGRAGSPRAGVLPVVGRRRPEDDQAGRGADGEALLFPHLRAESCHTCRRYLIDVDLGRDPRAVPEVDELVAVPIDLHMAEQGYTKITPNLMGF